MLPRPVPFLVLIAAASAAVLASCDGGTNGPAGTDVVSIRVTPSGVTLTALDATRQFTAVALDGSGDPVGGVSFQWSSSNPSVASVDASGLATALGNGSATITVSTDGASGNASVTVAQEPVDVDVSPSSVTLTEVGSTQRFSASATDANGHAIPSGRLSVAWSSSDGSVATVDGSGLATARGPGETTITAHAGSASGTAGLTVTLQQQGTVEVTPGDVAFTDVGVTEPLTARLVDAQGNEVPGATFTWTSSDPTTATVDEDGVVTSLREGTSEIVATSGELQGAAEISVDLPAGRVVWVPLDGGVWSDPLNWSSRSVPGADDDVFLTREGPYTVSLDVDAVVRSVQVGAAGGAQGFQVLQAVEHVLQISGESRITGSGLLDLRGAEVAGGGRLLNDGTVHLQEGLLSVPLENAAKLEVSSREPVLSPPGPVPAGHDPARARGAEGGPLAATEAGQSRIDGDLTTTSSSRISILGDRDVTDGSPPVTLTVADGFTNAGFIELIAAVLSGEAVLSIEGNGILENLGDLIARNEGGASGTNRLDAQLRNDGVVQVLERLLLDRPSSGHRNAGTIRVAARELFIHLTGTGPNVLNQGRIEVEGGATLTVDGGSVSHAGSGAFRGLVRLLRTTMRLDADLTVAGEMELDRSDVAGSGTLKNEGKTVMKDGSRVFSTLSNLATLRVTSSSTNPGSVFTSRIEGPLETGVGSVIEVGDPDAPTGGSPTVLDISAGFVNRGRLELIAEAPLAEARVLVGGSGEIDNQGEILSRGLDGIQEDNVLGARLKNAGSLTVASSRLRLDKEEVEHVNEPGGTIAVQAGELRLRLRGAGPIFTNRGAGTLDVASGASLVTDGGNLINESDGIIRGAGTLAVENAGVSLVDALVFDGRIRMSDGTLTGANTVTIRGTLELEGTATIDVPVDVAAGGRLFAHAPVAAPELQTNVEVFQPLTTHPGSRLDVLADGSGGTILSLESDLTNEGTLELINGGAGGEARVSVLDTRLINNGTVVSQGGGGGGTNLLDAPTFDNFGKVTVQDGSRLALAGATTNRSGGILEGDGTLEPRSSLRSIGIIRPGIEGPGVLTVDGDLALGPEVFVPELPAEDRSRIDMEVGGATAGTEHDQLVVTGQVSLEGRLEIVQIGGFVPSEGAQFPVMGFGGKAGDFASVGPQDVAGDETGLEWSSSTTATQFFLDVIRP